MRYTSGTKRARDHGKRDINGVEESRCSGIVGGVSTF